MAQISKLYISLDITMMMLLDHYVCFDSNKTMSFKAIDNRLLRKYTKIWKKSHQFNSQNLIATLFIVIMIKT